MDSFILLAKDEFLGIEVFDKDLYKLLLLLLINLVVSFILIRFIYYPNNNKNKETLFTFMLISTVVFFLGFALKSFKFNTGIAIGLFAIFGIIRFRTSTISVKEMSYFFAIIGVSLVNALSNKLSLVEVGVIDGVILALTFLMETTLNFGAKRVRLTKEMMQSKEVIYGEMANIKPQDKALLIADLESKTGLKIERIKLGTIDLKKEEVVIKVYYKQ